MSSANVVVLDNGGGQIKAGFAGDRNPIVTLPNCLIKTLSSKKYTPLLSPSSVDLTSASIRRPYDRGHLINPDLQREIWAPLFSTYLRISPSSSSLLLTQPLFSLPSITSSLLQIIFEDFNFQMLYLSDSPSLTHLYHQAGDSVGPVGKAAQCSLVVDCGFSFTHAAPVYQNVVLNYAVKRMDLGGKALTNYLMELVSYRSVNVMDETLIMDDVKEKLCYVSLDVDRDLSIARRRGNDNLLRCTYVLPDGITHTKGFVKDLQEAQKYRSLDDSVCSPSEGSKEDMEQDDVRDKRAERNKVDLTKNEFNLTNERFIVPEMIFRPADLGMNQAGLAECIVRAVNSCHPDLHPVLYERQHSSNWGSTLFPHFAERLERDLRPLVPDDYRVKITAQEDPILGVWQGSSLLASSPDFESMCVSKAEYEEIGSARCLTRFFQ